MKRFPIPTCLLFILVLSAGLQGYAQSRARPRAALRYEVDAKRTGTDMNSDDALPRSREFLRIDSTYYVGWLYEGAYRHNHAADYLGYRHAAIPLERALNLIERDYRKELATRTKDVMVYINNYPRVIDYAVIVDLLNKCYLNTEEPEKSFALMHRYARWNFQREFLDAYNLLMWVVHRNRFYTGDKYGFLRNSIKENEALANSYLDTALMRIRANARFNQGVYQPGYDAADYLGVYHYKSILHSYALRIDSAAHYYNLLRRSGQFPHNNYATFRMISGAFGEAEAEYQLAAMQDPGDKRLQEWAYYTSILQTYKGAPKSGELLMKEMIMAAGSTPGFGWYNIALARCLFYDGQISESRRHADKASEFKELHIGTTLGQSHYDFSIQLNRLMVKEAQWEMQRFEHRNWWYNLQALGNMARMASERYLQQFLIINMLAQNPERDLVVYKLLSTESTVGWDEIWYLIHDFSTRFFLNRFQQEAKTDPREKVRKYFRLFAARLLNKDREYGEARLLLNSILANPDTDTDYEQLFIARVYQAMAENADGRDEEGEQAEWLIRMYRTYPQLVPFTGMQLPMQLQVTGTPDAEALDRLKACNIRWTTGDVTAPRAVVTFSRKGEVKIAEYAVIDNAGNYIVPRQKFSYKQSSGAGIALAYRLFGIGGMVPKGEGNAVALVSNNSNLSQKWQDIKRPDSLVEVK